MKNADSTQIVRIPNMVLIKNNVTKGVDRIPFSNELFGRNWMGPVRKNLVIPKDAANKLRRNDKRGRKESKVGK